MLRAGPRLAGPLAGLLLGCAAACAGPAEPPQRERSQSAAPPAAPLTTAAYGRLLAKRAGGPVSVPGLLAEAERARRTIAARMDRLAAEIRPGAGWRELFAELGRDAPEGRDELLAAYRRELERAAEFVVERRLVSVPAAQPEVVVLENEALRGYFPLGLYHDGRLALSIEPGSLASHCRVCIPPLAVHEGYPGHHVAFWRYRRADGEPPRLAELARYKPYVEGWGLYAELLMLEHGYYERPERRLGAWRLVLLRTLRAEIDARLHGGGLTAEAAEQSYRRELVATPAAAAAEVRMHLAKPGVKASYFVGLLQILELRQRVRGDGEGLDWLDFHDRLLGPPATLPAVARERFGVELGELGGWRAEWDRTELALD